MAEILFAHGGTVDKFMGDGILSFFGDPFDLPNHTEQCIKAAVAMQKKVRVLAQRMESNAPVGGILVTADVWERVKDKFTFTEKRDVTVKGYGEAIEAWVVEISNQQ